MNDAANDRPQDAATLLDVERTAWRRWQAFIDGLSLDARRADGWRVHDVVAHVAAWHRRSDRDLATIAAGAEDDDRQETDAFNEDARRAWADRTPEELLAEAAAAHAAFEQAIAGASPATLAAHDGLGATLIAQNGWEHYEDHLRDRFNPAG
jgi:hypothetical protein